MLIWFYNFDTQGDPYNLSIKFGLITRTVKDTRPPTVLYELSEKGKGSIEFLF